MKKYVKPDLIYEQFELTRHIADCGWELKSGDENSCIAVEDKKFLGGLGVTLFAHSACGANPQEVHIEDYCYEAGTNGQAGLFKS